MNISRRSKEKLTKKKRRHVRIRIKLFGTSQRPRLCVFRSNQHIYAQLIDDASNKTLAVSSDLDHKKEKKTSKDSSNQLQGKKGLAYEVGKEIAQKAKSLNINEAIFDRGGSRYHGRIKSLAEGARDAGLKI